MAPPAKPRFVYQCVGYDDHGVTRHASSCPGSFEWLEWYVRQLQRHYGQDHPPLGRGTFRMKAPQPGFVDEEKRTTRCRKCILAAMAIAITERRLRSVSKERIYSRTQRVELLRDTFTLLNPGFKATKEGQARGRAAQRGRVGKKSALSRWWADGASHVLIGRCLGCGLITIAINQPRATAEWHHDCLIEWHKTPQGKAWWRSGRSGGIGAWVRRGQGNPETATKRHFGWAVRHHLLGQGVREIARSEDVSAAAVSKEIKAILNELPEASKVAPRFQKSLLVPLRHARQNSVNTSPQI